MKTFIYGIAFIAITGCITLAACGKHEVQSPTSKIGTSIEKSDGLTDNQLIDIIKGRNPDYTKIEQIEGVLLDNCKLSSSVIRTFIDESRYPNYMVEEIMILSAPISSVDLAYLHSARPTLSTVTIVAASEVDWSNSEYVIVNSSPRQLLVAKDLTRKSLCEDGCGESEYKGTDFVTLHLTATTISLDPAEMIDCDGVRWYCGKATESRVVLSDGNTTVIVIKCVGSDGKCASRATATKS